MKSVYLAAVTASTVLFLSGPALAKGGGHSGHRGHGGHSGHSGHTSSHESATDEGGTPAHEVKGFYRKDGTYVAPHRATNADGTLMNNWSTKGNVNPDSGKVGTKEPAPN